MGGIICKSVREQRIAQVVKREYVFQVASRGVFKLAKLFLSDPGTMRAYHTAHFLSITKIAMNYRLCIPTQDGSVNWAAVS